MVSWKGYLLKKMCTSYACLSFFLLLYSFMYTCCLAYTVFHLKQSIESVNMFYSIRGVCSSANLPVFCDNVLLKGTVQQKLTGVESDINRKVFLSHWTTDNSCLNFKRTCFLKSKKLVSVAKAKICGLSNSMGRPLQITDSPFKSRADNFPAFPAGNRFCDL